MCKRRKGVKIGLCASPWRRLDTGLRACQSRETCLLRGNWVDVRSKLQRHLSTTLPTASFECRRVPSFRAMRLVGTNDTNLNRTYVCRVDLAGLPQLLQRRCRSLSLNISQLFNPHCRGVERKTLPVGITKATAHEACEASRVCP